MSIKNTIIAIVAIVVVALGAHAILSSYDRQIANLQRYSDSVTVLAWKEKDTAHAMSERVTLLVDSLQRTKRPIVVRVSKDSLLVATADSAVAEAQTAHDSVTALVQEVVTLKDENQALRGVVALDSIEFVAEKQRGDSLLAVVDRQNVLITHLNTHVAELLPRVPSWLRTVATVAKYGTVFVAGVEAGKHF